MVSHLSARQGAGALPKTILRRLTTTEDVLDTYFLEIESSLFSGLYSNFDKPEAKEVMGAIAEVVNSEENS